MHRFDGVFIKMRDVRVVFFHSSRKNANKNKVAKTTGGTTSGCILTTKYLYFG